MQMTALFIFRNFFYTFSSVLSYCFVTFTAEKTQVYWLQKRSLIKTTRREPLPPHPGWRRSSGEAPVATCRVAFRASFPLEKWSARSYRQPEVPRSSKTVPSGHWQRYGIFEEYLYPIKLLLLYTEQYELMFPFVSHFILSARLCFYWV